MNETIDQMRGMLVAQADVQIAVGRNRRPHILTADVMETIPAMIASGLKCKDIAETLGCTQQTLQVQCSKRGISLRKGGRRPPAKTLKLAEAKLSLSTEAAIKLQARAWARGLSEETLASALLEVIVQDDLFAAVLDLEPELA
jgi:hypothetical protein